MLDKSYLCHLREEIRSKRIFLAAGSMNRKSKHQIFQSIIHALLSFCNDSRTSIIKHQFKGLLETMPKQNLAMHVGEIQVTRSVLFGEFLVQE
jgi:hypothetical protein